ncbi:MATE family efflux transporter [Paenibacillus farraposensis]|uniref:Probable multidrug resistance protein NorM n=1 Tax=Paenibacillus farraposensis TaxID=2807095 RepID=A0ABW4DBG8_9BACL|nr:MATE family efflux transporter [Paenibacillus farraposensis]MCC3381492.1 MATE family efflux transporter [Paenibacillus farraposensis]
MQLTLSIGQKWRQFFYILLPILITQLALSAMTFFDTNMSGHFSPADLAGVAIGVSLWIPVQTGLNGILMAITPIVSQLVGAQHKDKVSYYVIQALWLSLVLSILVLIAGIFLINPILNSMKLEPRVHNVAFYYLFSMAFGIIPLFAYTVLRSFMDALGQTRFTMMITLISLPINILLNYLLIYGNWGFPRLGGVGSGAATATTYWIIMLIAGITAHRGKKFAEYRIFSKIYGIAASAWKELIHIGVPIGFAIFFETAIFSAVTLLMSSYNTVTIAAHQAAMNFASTLYMLPLSICMALTILVGYETGAKRSRDAKTYSVMGIGSAVGLSLITAIGLLIWGEQVARLYSNDPQVIQLTQHFLIYAIFFQISDAIATPTQGALRGYKDVNPAFLLTFLSYWVIGLPVGYVLARWTSWGPYGYWIGLITGLAVGAILFLWRLMLVQRHFTVKKQHTEAV